MRIKTLCCLRILCRMNAEPRMMLSGNMLESRTFHVNFAAKIGGRWRFSDLISYFCRRFRASADGAGHIYERFVTFSFTLKLRKFDLLKEM